MSITKVSTQVKIGEIIVTHIYLKAKKERESRGRKERHDVARTTAAAGEDARREVF